MKLTSLPWTSWGLWGTSAPASGWCRRWRPRWSSRRWWGPTGCGGWWDRGQNWWEMFDVWINWFKWSCICWHWHMSVRFLRKDFFCLLTWTVQSCQSDSWGQRPCWIRQRHSCPWWWRRGRSRTSWLPGMCLSTSQPWFRPKKKKELWIVYCCLPIPKLTQYTSSQLYC